MQQALEALCCVRDMVAHPDNLDFIDKHTAALRERLAQPEWQGLTDEEIKSVCHKRDWTAPWTDTTFARAIEAKLKEKNT